MGEAHGAARAEGVVLGHVAQAHAVVDVTEHALDAVGEEPAGEDRLGHAVAAQPVEHEGEERPAREGQDRLRGGEGEGPEPGALAAREDERLHGYLPTPS